MAHSSFFTLAMATPLPSEGGGCVAEPAEKDTARSRETATWRTMVCTGQRFCRWCCHSNTTPNPLTYDATCPYLPWRRLCGQECKMCPYVIESNNLLMNRTREQLLDRLRDPDAFNEYKGQVASYEAAKRLAAHTDVQGCGTAVAVETCVGVLVAASLVRRAPQSETFEEGH